MTKRALVVGSALEPLFAPVNDVRAMTVMLEARGFLVEASPEATRADILDGYDRLIERSEPDDTAVVYYAGHGFVGRLEDGRTWQCIAPFDVRSGTKSDWRGITDRELSIKQRQLTRRTKNVTVILDCCSAGQMSRDAAALGGVVRTLPHPVHVGFDAHVAALREKYGADAVADEMGNEHAVRFVACGQSGKAFEAPDKDGVVHGYFTANLIAALADARGAITWNTLAEVVRARVMTRFASQRPAIEGPGERRVFELGLGDRTRVASVTVVDREYELRTGMLAGDRRGDTYAVLPSGATVYEPDRELAQLEVVDVDSFTSRARRTSGTTELHDGAIAVPILRTAPRHPIRIDVPDDARDAITSAIGNARTLCISDDDPVATLRLAEGQLTIEDAWGPTFPPAAYPDELAPMIRNLANLGVARSLRALHGAHGVAATEVEIEQGHVVGGTQSPLPDVGANLGERDRLYVRVKNVSDRRLFVHLLNIGLRGRIKLSSANVAGLGIQLDPEDQFVFGERDNLLAGIGLTWPDGLPRQSFPREDQVVVIVTTIAIDLRGLETQEFVPATRNAGTPLEALLGQLQDGLTRSAESVDGFHVKLMSYLLHPRASTFGRVSFAVDENPGETAAALAPAAWRRAGASFSAVEIRLAEIEGPPGTRLDVLVCTRGGKSAWTAALPLQEPILFRGTVRDFVEIAVFASQTEITRSLAELLADPDASVADATDALAPDDTPWAAAAGASAVLVRIAYERLRSVTGTTVGLYRSSFVRSERFGVGRHPRESRYHAQGLAFAVLVEELPEASVG